MPHLGVPKEVSDLVGGLPILQGFETPIHKFSTADGNRFISLNQDFLALTEKQYVRWSDFRTELLRIEEALGATFAPPFYERLGLRYKNVVNKSSLGVQNESWAALLNPSLIGCLGADEIANEITEIRTQLVLKAENDSSTFIRIAHGFPQNRPARDLYILDVDIFSEQRRETQNAPDAFNHFNSSAFRLFHWFTTDTLRRVLEPVE
jgi:uncharacterized protein (TIGR04255 family)